MANAFILLTSNDGSLKKRFRVVHPSYTETNLRKQTIQETATGKLDIQHGSHYRAWQMTVRTYRTEPASNTGMAQAGSTTSITLANTADSTTNDIYNTQTISLLDGAGSGQTAVITDYVATTRVATASFAIAPDNTTEYSVTSLYGTAADLESFFDYKTSPGDRITYTDFFDASFTVYITGDYESEPQSPGLDGATDYSLVPLAMRESDAK
jgi:hypothetical protein